MSLQMVFMTMLLPASMTAEILSLKLVDLEKVSEHTTSGLRDHQVNRRDAYKYPAEETTYGVGYGHHLHPFYYKGKTNAYDCALQGEWHPIVPGAELDFVANDDNIVRTQPLLNTRYNKAFPDYWKDLLYNYELLAPNARAYSLKEYYSQESQQQQHRSDNITTTKSLSAPVNKEITTYLTPPPPFSVSTNWRNVFNVPQQNNNNNPTNMMDLITALHNSKIIPLLEEDDDDDIL